MNQVPVKGIVFFSGEPAHSLVGLSRGEIRDLDPHSEEGILRIPTVHGRPFRLESSYNVG